MVPRPTVASSSLGTAIFLFRFHKSFSFYSFVWVMVFVIRSSGYSLFVRLPGSVCIRLFVRLGDFRSSGYSFFVRLRCGVEKRSSGYAFTNFVRLQKRIHPDEFFFHPDEFSIHPDEFSIHPDEFSFHPGEGTLRLGEMCLFVWGLKRFVWGQN